MDALMAELESAAEGSRELDQRVLLASGWRVDGCGYWWARIGNLGFHGKKEIHLLPRPTTSVDAALKLVLKEYYTQVSEASGPGRTDWSAVLSEREESPKPPYRFMRGRARTPALALCIAALRVRQAMEAA